MDLGGRRASFLFSHEARDDRWRRGGGEFGPLVSERSMRSINAIT